MTGEPKTRGQTPSLWRRFIAEKRGAAALEFAFVAPFMLVLYLLSMEFSLAIEVSKKVSRVASQVADLVTQQSSITPTELEAIIKIGDATLQPFQGTPAVEVTALEVTTDSPPEARVVWSKKWDGETLQSYLPPKQEDKSVPEALMVPGAFLVRAEVTLDYNPVIAPSQGSSVLGISDGMFPINMSEQYYMQPRVTRRIACKGC